MIGRREARDAQAFDDAWSSGRATDPAVAELVRAAELLCEAASVAPNPGFTYELRSRLMTEAETTLLKITPVRRETPAALVDVPRRTRRRVAKLAGAALTCVGAVGIVASSASAVPGDVLYPVKRGVENVSLTLHQGDASRGEFQLSRASERLTEARTLADGGSLTLLAGALEDFKDQATDGSTLLFHSFEDGGDTEAIETVNRFADEASAELTTLSSLLPDDADAADAAFRDATSALSSLATRSYQLCAACSDGAMTSLANVVTQLVPGPGPGTTPTPAVTETGAAKPTPVPTPAQALPNPSPSAAAPSSQPAATPAPTPKPIIKSPSPSAPPPTSLPQITEPLVGALLGDDEQQGVVPGLVNGLLGQDGLVGGLLTPKP